MRTVKTPKGAKGQGLVEYGCILFLVFLVACIPFAIIIAVANWLFPGSTVGAAILAFCAGSAIGWFVRGFYENRSVKLGKAKNG